MRRFLALALPPLMGGALGALLAGVAGFQPAVAPYLAGPGPISSRVDTSLLAYLGPGPGLAAGLAALALLRALLDVSAWGPLLAGRAPETQRKPFPLPGVLLIEGLCLLSALPAGAASVLLGATRYPYFAPAVALLGLGPWTLFPPLLTRLGTPTPRPLRLLLLAPLHATILAIGSTLAAWGWRTGLPRAAAGFAGGAWGPIATLVVIRVLALPPRPHHALPPLLPILAVLGASFRPTVPALPYPRTRAATPEWVEVSGPSDDGAAPGAAALLLVPGIDTTEERSSLYQLDPASLGFPPARTFRFSYAGPDPNCRPLPFDASKTQQPLTLSSFLFFETLKCLRSLGFTDVLVVAQSLGAAVVAGGAPHTPTLQLVYLSPAPGGPLLPKTALPRVEPLLAAFLFLAEKAGKTSVDAEAPFFAEILRDPKLLDRTLEGGPPALSLWAATDLLAWGPCPPRIPGPRAVLPATHSSLPSSPKTAALIASWRRTPPGQARGDFPAWADWLGSASSSWFPPILSVEGCALQTSTTG